MLENCDKCENSIQTSSHCNAGIPFTLCLVLSDIAAVFRCDWRSRGRDSDGNARCQCNVSHCEEFDACHLDWRPRRSTGFGTPDYPNSKALDDKEAVRIETRKCETTCSDTTGECTPCWSRMEWGPASKTKDRCGEINFTGCFRPVECS